MCYFHIVKKSIFFFRQFIFISYIFVLVSCDYFLPKQTENIPIDTVIDYTTVDAFPLFPACKNIPSREKQKICFQIKMAENINALLKSVTFKISSKTTDTLFVALKVLRNGKTQIVSVRSKNKNKASEKLVDSLLRSHISKIPVLIPAVKRGIPVNTQFTLPVIIKPPTF